MSSLVFGADARQPLTHSPALPDLHRLNSRSEASHSEDARGAHKEHGPPERRAAQTGRRVSARLRDLCAQNHSHSNREVDAVCQASR